MARPKLGVLTQQYLQSLARPFDYNPPLMGFGSGIPVSRGTAFFRLNLTIPAGNYAFYVFRTCVTNNLYTYINTLAQVNTAWQSAGNANATNQVSISGRYNSGRAVSGGMRIRMPVAPTSAPPLVQVGNIYDLLNNVAALTPAATVQQSQLIPMSNMNNAYECTWRPSDAYDFQLNGAPVSTAGYPGTLDVVHSCIFVNNTSNANAQTVFLEGIFHFEGNGGVDNAGEDFEDALVDELPEPFAALRVVAKNATSVTRDLFVTTASTFIDRMTHRMSSSGMGLSLRSEGGLVGDDGSVGSALRTLRSGDVFGSSSSSVARSLGGVSTSLPLRSIPRTISENEEFEDVSSSTIPSGPPILLRTKPPDLTQRL